MDQHDKNPLQDDPNLERNPDDREDTDITNREEDLQPLHSRRYAG